MLLHTERGSFKKKGSQAEPYVAHAAKWLQLSKNAHSCMYVFVARFVFGIPTGDLNDGASTAGDQREYLNIHAVG